MSKDKGRFTIYVQFPGAAPVPIGAAPTLQAAISQIQAARAVAFEVYAGGYGTDPAADVWSVYDDREAMTRWTST